MRTETGRPIRRPGPIECASRFDLSPALRSRAAAKSQQYSSTPSRHPGFLHVYEEPLVRCTDNSLRAVLHGEFDPGSGRTLAACLTHASGATNRASARGKAANG